MVRLAFRVPGKRIVAACAVLMLTTATVIASVPPQTAEAGTGGRFTFATENRASYWGVTFAGAGYGEIPFAIDSNNDWKQELAVYYNGRMTIRNDNGTYWGFNFPGGGYGEIPLAVDMTPKDAWGYDDPLQQFAVYYNGRFTWRSINGTSYGGVTFPGAGKLDMPLAIDTDGNGAQEFAVYQGGTFRFLRDNGSVWSVPFAGANASDIPFAIDTNGDYKEELAVYRDGRVTVRNDNNTYWGFNFAGAGIDELPLAIDSNGNGIQEFVMYNHVPMQTTAKQLLTMRNTSMIGIADYSESPARDTADRSLASLQLADMADGGYPRLSTRCSYASQLPSTIVPDPNFVRFLVDYGTKGRYTISTLFGQCHSGPNSLHHKGKAVDLTCGANLTVGDQVGTRYGIWRNYETCAANGHWHYSVGGQ